MRFMTELLCCDLASPHGYELGAHLKTEIPVQQNVRILEMHQLRPHLASMFLPSRLAAAGARQRASRPLIHAPAIAAQARYH
jgi:hypothetical protein